MSSNQAGASRLHPLVATAAVSVTVLSLAGIGAMTGLIPTPFAKSADPLAQTPVSAATVAPAAPVALAAPVAPPVIATAPAPKPVAAPRPVASTSRPVAPAPVASRPAVDPNQATVVSIDRVEVAGEGSGIGAVGGGVIGGLLGNQVGGGNGRKAMTVVGAVGGAVAGNAIEKKVKSTAHYEVRVRLADGSTRTMRYAEQPAFQPGDRIRVDDPRAS